VKRIAIVLLAASPALADNATTPLDVKLGKSIEVKVGYARGYMCDDPTLVDAELVTREDANWWVVTGKKLGKTQCKVGSAYDSPTYYVFDVRVIAAPKK